MTLREKLDEKVKTSPTPMWEEIESIFLSIDPMRLKDGVTLTIFKKDASSRIYYEPEITTAEKLLASGKASTSFSRDYTISDLEKALKIAQENGMKVTCLIGGLLYWISYTPSWK